MNLFREILSALFFLAALLLPFELLETGFDWVLVLGSLGCFLLAYFIWPSKKRGKRQDDHWLLDFLEIIIELPVEILLWSFRLLARIIGGKGGGIDIDL